MGVPAHGVDLAGGVDLFQQRHPQTVEMYDAKHKAACLLKARLERNPRWRAFQTRVAQTRRSVQQTELAFLTPPGPKPNPGRTTVAIEVTNLGDRPIQVGSHYHFIETNASLKFDRAASYGKRLDIPAGTAVRFEPGDTKTVTLVAIAGHMVIRGGNNLADGPMSDEGKEQAMQRVKAGKFADDQKPASSSSG